MCRLIVVALVGGVSLVAGGAAAVWTVSRSAATEAVSKETLSSPQLAPATPLDLRELLEPGPKLKPSAKAESLNGKRVRVAGFMAEMEEAVEGAFYLVPRPISLDESGAGTGDLPLQSILVLVPAAEGRSNPHIEGELEGIGVLEVGNHADEQGRVSNFRLRLDPDQRLQQPRAAAAESAP